MNQGFTLIELLITMVIIGILSAVLFVGKVESEEKLALQRAAYALVQDIRELQEMTIGGKEIDCGGSSTRRLGVYFNKFQSPTSYIIFADCGVILGKKDNLDKELREVFLEKGVKIFNLDPSPLDPLSIVFQAPDPLTYLGGKNEKEDWSREAEITLSLESDESVQKTIKINTVGRMEIE